jgi:hypothetical protein
MSTGCGEIISGNANTSGPSVANPNASARRRSGAARPQCDGANDGNGIMRSIAAHLRPLAALPDNPCNDPEALTGAECLGLDNTRKRNGRIHQCKGDGDFIATVLKTAIAAVFPGSFKQSIAMLLKCKLGDQNVSDHEAILSGTNRIDERR